MSLTNRVLPNGKIVAEKWRGDFMGNKGGRIHNPETKILLKRQWASKRWIICVTKFKNRQRTVMGNSYTELFFLDEVSALAAGHRPCYECRRKDANAFADAWINAYGKPQGSMADTMDRQLHEERIGEKEIISFNDALQLPDGIMVASKGNFFAKYNSIFLKWSGAGYEISQVEEKSLTLLTPQSIIDVFRKGFTPVWHQSVLRRGNHGCS